MEMNNGRFVKDKKSHNRPIMMLCLLIAVISIAVIFFPEISNKFRQRNPGETIADSLKQTPAASSLTINLAGENPDTELFPDVTICIDPGHPSEINSGRTIQNGVTELAMNWEVSLKLAQILEEKHHIQVIKTREDREEMTTNRRRAMIANEADAILFLRLHCDTGAGTGFTLYYPDGQGTKEGKTGPPLDLIEESHIAAKAVHEGMTELLSGVLADNGIRGESMTYIGGRQGALTGSIFAEVPAVTVEMVFLSNRDDAAFISSEEGQELMARALSNGIVNYAKVLRRKS
jgi:N-acetylmuramoyl-L-alanine amidase